MIETEYHIEANPAELDARLRRLEAALTALSDTHLMEDRVADRVVEQLKQSAPKPALADTGRFHNGSADGNESPPMATLAPPISGSDNSQESFVWLPFQLWGEVRTFVRMLADHRYVFSFAGRIGPLCIAVLYLFAMWIGTFPFVGWIIERPIDIVLAVLLYKVLHREIRRYRSMFR